MAFANGITTFYLPTSANAGASLRGSDVRKLLDSADAGSDATTKTSHGTGGNTTRDLDPYTTNSSDLTTSDYGWAVDPADMGSTATKKRVIFAGDHVFTFRTASSQAQLSAGNSYTVFAYRIGPAPGRTATLLGSATGSAFNYGSIANVYRTENVTLNLPEIVLEDDETIQYSAEISSPGAAISGRVNSHNTGTQGGVSIRIDHPGLGTLAETTGTAAGTSTVTADVANITATNGTASGAATATAEVGGIAGTTGTADGAATVTAEVGGVAGTTGTSAGSSTATADAALIKATVGTVDISAGGGTTVRPVFIFDD